MKVSTENNNNFGYEKNYDCGRQYPFNLQIKWIGKNYSIIAKLNWATPPKKRKHTHTHPKQNKKDAKKKCQGWQIQINIVTYWQVADVNPMNY